MTTRIGFVLFPKLTQLDLTGPFEVFGRVSDAQVLLVGQGEARSDTGLVLRPDSSFAAALVLGAAGLLRGYRATTHWLSLDLLAGFGAIPVRERVVVDRNRITGGGVTAGIDFGLRLAAELRGEKAAKEIQL